MKIEIKQTKCSTGIRSQCKTGGLLAGLLLAGCLAASAQQTVFYDTFSTSSLNQTNIAGGIPGGTPTESQTSYTVASGKNALATFITTNHLDLITSATSSGNSEVQAVFTKYPVTLASVGDYIEMTYTFTDTKPILQSSSATTAALFMGLFDSGGVPPQSGTVLQNGGTYTSSQTSADTGGTMGWQGYNAQIYNNYTWYLGARPAQTAANNLNQLLLYNYPLSAGSHNGGNPGSPNLVPGAQYTCQLRVTLSGAGALSVSNALYTGVGTGGTLFYSNAWSNITGSEFLTTNFDSLAIGYRAANSVVWTNDINSITVVASLAAQAGPYFYVTSSGNPCAGGLTIGLSGSVTTNAYLLYTNGAYSGETVVGTGSPLSFGLQTTSGQYTVMASNTITGSEGPMLGSAGIFVGQPAITNQPASVTVVTNVAAQFSVQASGNELTYQWYRNGTAMTNGGNISGAESSILTVNPTGAGDVESGVNGYYVVLQDPCGNIVTSTPYASLTLIPPHNLTWQGGNPGSAWDYSDLNFTNPAGTPQAFVNGDDVTFNDNSSFTTVTVSNNMTPTLVTVNATQAYTINGSDAIVGFGQLQDLGTGILTIANDNTYTGGTLVVTNATLQLGDGTSTHGSLHGTVTVETNAILDYLFAGPGSSGQVNTYNSLAGSGVVNVMDNNGSTVATLTTAVSSNFNGTINIQGYTDLHASDGNAGYALGNGATVNVASGTQAWLDRSATAYNDTFNISGTGWLGATPQTGAIRIYGSTINGPVNLLANARIGGTINGGTIQSVISGPYQMEVWGTAGSYVLNLGPTNGMPQGYGSTLITSGSINAMNTNAISTGPLTLDLAGDLRLNGNNLTVSNLSSINSGQVTSTTGPTIRNNNSKVAATLTVGTDGTSTEFDGTFLNGGAAPLGLTKVGAGVLTLTGVNTNTGAVTVLGGSILLSGSGSFGQASVIAVGPGGIFDVSARTDTTLTLNAVQTLEHAGGVAGPITVTGNVNLGGTLLLGVNHMGLANDTLAASGTVTYGGTLAVTNLGAALQTGDSFQLFPGATAGFASFNLQTVDSANNTVYTWNNTVATDGKITVASVAPLVNTKSAPVTYLVSGGNLTLSWPPDHLGWYLQEQTNGLATGLTTNWVTVPTSDTVTQMTLPLGATNGAVFFRMVYTNAP